MAWELKGESLVDPGRNGESRFKHWIKYILRDGTEEHHEKEHRGGSGVRTGSHQSASHFPDGALPSALVTSVPSCGEREK